MECTRDYKVVQMLKADLKIQQVLQSKQWNINEPSSGTNTISKVIAVISIYGQGRSSRRCYVENLK